MTCPGQAVGMDDSLLHRLLDPGLLHHQQLPSDVIVWAARGEVISREAHLRTEREMRVKKREASRPELERLAQSFAAIKRHCR